MVTESFVAGTPTNYSQVPALTGSSAAAAVQQMPAVAPTNYSQVPSLDGMVPAAQASTNYSNVPALDALVAAPATRSVASPAPANYSVVPSLGSVSAVPASPLSSRAAPAAAGNYSNVPSLSSFMAASASPAQAGTSYSDVPLLSNVTPAPAQALDVSTSSFGTSSVGKKSKGVPKGYSDIPQADGVAAPANAVHNTETDYDLASNNNPEYLTLDEVSAQPRQPKTDTQYKALPSSFFQQQSGAGDGGFSSDPFGDSMSDGMYASLPEEADGPVASTNYEPLNLGAQPNSAQQVSKLSLMRELREVDAEARGVVKYLRNVEKLADAVELMALMTFLIDRTGAILASRLTCSNLDSDHCASLRKIVSSLRDYISDVTASSRLVRYLKQGSLRSHLAVPFEPLLLWMNEHYRCFLTEPGPAAVTSAELLTLIPGRGPEHDDIVQSWMDMCSKTPCAGFSLPCDDVFRRLSQVERFAALSHVQKLFAFCTSMGSQITVVKYAEFCRAFGPLGGTLSRFSALFSLPYFYGFVSREDSERVLANEPERSFLIRFSGFRLDAFVLVVKKARAADHVLMELKYPSRMYELTLSLRGKFEALSFAQLPDAVAHLAQAGIISEHVDAEYLRTPVFHGDLTVEEVEVILGSESVGSFLIRWSATAGCFTVSLYKGPGTIQHSRIVRSTTGYRENDTGKEYASISELLDVNRSRLEHPVVGKLGAVCYYASLIVT